MYHAIRLSTADISENYQLRASILPVTYCEPIVSQWPLSPFFYDDVNS